VGRIMQRVIEASRHSCGISKCRVRGDVFHAFAINKNFPAIAQRFQVGRAIHGLCDSQISGCFRMSGEGLRVGAQGLVHADFLVSSDFEIALCCPERVRARDRSVIGPDIVQFAVRNEMLHGALGILGVGFQMEHPFEVSSVADLIRTLSGPGLIMPEIVLPSQFMMTVT
jgi:hypothetical protein